MRYQICVLYVMVPSHGTCKTYIPWIYQISVTLYGSVVLFVLFFYSGERVKKAFVYSTLLYRGFTKLWHKLYVAISNLGGGPRSFIH